MLANMAMESSKIRLSRTLRGAFAVVKQTFKTMAKDRGLELETNSWAISNSKII